MDIARQVIAIRKLSDSPKDVTMIRNRVGAALLKMKVRGWVEEVPQGASTRAGAWPRAGETTKAWQWSQPMPRVPI